MTALVFASIFADSLNLNGDQANLFVLQQRLKWAGHSSTIAPVSSLAELEQSKADFLFLGHGSIAAWKACEAQWPSLAKDFLTFSNSRSALAVSSGADRVLAASGAQPAVLGASVSEFCLDDFDSQKILGYKNTSSIANSTLRVERAILTWLHGPVLAKNPAVADAILSDLLSISPKGLANENTRKIDEIVAGVWHLEMPKK